MTHFQEQLVEKLSNGPKKLDHHFHKTIARSLITKGFVVKNGIEYSLTEKGKEACETMQKSGCSSLDM